MIILKIKNYHQSIKLQDIDFPLKIHFKINYVNGFWHNYSFVK